MKTLRLKSLLSSFLLLALNPQLGLFAAEIDKPNTAAFLSRWVGEISPEKVLPEYPRPQMVEMKRSSKA